MAFLSLPPLIDSDAPPGWDHLTPEALERVAGIVSSAVTSAVRLSLLHQAKRRLYRMSEIAPPTHDDVAREIAGVGALLDGEVARASALFAYAGARALRKLGIEARPAFGAATWRKGSGASELERHGFAADGRLELGLDPCRFHAWVVTRSRLIDFSLRHMPPKADDPVDRPASAPAATFTHAFSAPMPDPFSSPAAPYHYQEHDPESRLRTAVEAGWEAEIEQACDGVMERMAGFMLARGDGDDRRIASNET